MPFLATCTSSAPSYILSLPSANLTSALSPSGSGVIAVIFFRLPSKATIWSPTRRLGALSQLSGCSEGFAGFFSGRLAGFTDLGIAKPRPFSSRRMSSIITLSRSARRLRISPSFRNRESLLVSRSSRDFRRAKSSSSVASAM